MGGPRMEAQGLQSRFPLETLSVMGLVEVLEHQAFGSAGGGGHQADVLRLQAIVAADQVAHSAVNAHSRNANPRGELLHREPA